MNIGVLKTDLTVEDVTKYVIARNVDILASDTYEIICVMGNNEDYFPVCTGLIPFARVPANYCKEAVNHFLSQHAKKGLPVYTCEVSHKKEVMTLEQATQLFFSTTEAWVA